MLDAFLDKSLLGYTSLGYLLRGHPPITADLHGQTALVTGATSGLGKAAARQLALLGARIVIVGRSEQKLERTESALRSAVPSASVRGELADLSLMGSIRTLADRIDEPLHILVNNVGVLLPERTETQEGLEQTFATNLLGQFLLTNLLTDRLASAATPSLPSRVVNVSSGGMYTQRVRVDDLQMTRTHYNGNVAYARTKRAQIILTEMWAEQLADKHITVHAMHPGWADTTGVSTALPWFYRLTKPLLRTPEQGADTIVWLAASREPQRSTGFFWHDRRPRPVHRLRKTKERPEEHVALWAELLEACKNV